MFALRPLKRKTPMRARKPMRQRRSRPRRSPQVHDSPYLAWLVRQPCCCPELHVHPGGDVHHPRHSVVGGSLGAMLKADDDRGVPLSRQHHRDLHALAGPFRGWTGSQLRAWLDEQATIYAYPVHTPNNVYRN